MQLNVTGKLGNNRLTRPIKCWIVKTIVSRRGLREKLNQWYEKLNEQSKECFYVRYAKIFRNSNARLDPGGWTVTFLDVKITLPLRSDHAWLDWDNAVSILGHDLEIKQTYAALLASSQRPDCFMDVGANYGMHSVLFMSAGVPVVAFEPNPSCEACFRTIQRINGFSGRLETVAVGNQNGTTQLVYPERETWLGSLSDNVVSSLKGRGSVRVQETQIKKLDDYFDDIPQGNIVIKIDVEGLELDVLQGAPRILSAHSPHIIFESNDRSIRPDLSKIFEKYNYDVYSLPWRPSTTAKPLRAAEFFSNAAHNFIAIINNDAVD
jgi:FkbM family methyltransferase